MPAESRDIGIRQRIALLEDARPLRTRAIEVMDYEPGNDPAGANLSAPGTITVLLARSSSYVLPEIRKQLQEKRHVDSALLDKVFSPLASHPRVKPEEIPALLKEQAVFAEIRYGCKGLTGPLFVPADLEVCVVTCPYNGGRLSKTAFTLAERYQEGSAAALDAVVVARSPVLNQAERTALSQMEDSQLETNVGYSVSTRLPSAGEEYLVVPAEGNEPGEYYYVSGDHPDIAAWQKLFAETAAPNDELLRLGPAASARKLLALRRHLLQMRG